MLTAGNKDDAYAGLDRYGRWKRVAWGDNGLDYLAEDRVYTYDRMGNVRLTDNVAGGHYQSHQYAYDGLNRLVDYQVGLNSGGTIAGGNVHGSESWTLDALGNWRSHSVVEFGSGLSPRTDTRTPNKANEIETYTGVRGTNPLFAPVYDANGNITFTGKTTVETAPISYNAYDGWNRQVRSDDNNSGSSTDAGDSRTNYDGLGRMIGQFVDTVQDGTNNVGNTEEYFYNTSGQIVEVYTNTVTGGVSGSTPKLREQTVWDASYVNAPAVQRLDSNADGTLDQRLYPTWDANYNITSLVADHGYTVERYFLTPYGGPPVAMNGAKNYAGTGADDGLEWYFDSNGTDYAAFRLGFQGMRWDPVAWEFRTMTRAYLPSLGTFAGRDPLGTKAYLTEGMNLYQYVASNSLKNTDPTGLTKKMTWSECYDLFNKRVAKINQDASKDYADALGQGGINGGLAIVAGGISWILWSNPVTGAVVVIAEGGASGVAGILDAHSADSIQTQRLKSAKAALQECLRKNSVSCAPIDDSTGVINT